jgi:hypothetical protein
MAYSSFYQPEITGQTDDPQQDDKEYQAHLKREAELRKRINEGIVHALKCGRGRSAPGTCFTYLATDKAFTGLESDNKEGFQAIPKIFAGRDASDQLERLEARTGKLLEGAEINKQTIHEGMVIGIAPTDTDITGVKDVTRTGVVFKDPKTGKLMFAESSAGGKIQCRTVDQLLADAAKHKKKLFAGDLTQLAETVGARPRKNFDFSKQPAADSKFTNRETLPEDTEKRAELREAINAGIEKWAEDAMKRHVKYGWGVKDGKTRIDCSGFVFKTTQAGFKNLEHKPKGDPVDALRTGAAWQIDTVLKKTGKILTGNTLDIGQLREGMVIGMDTGVRSHEVNDPRPRGIDHIVTVYKDKETGKLMVAESSGCDGVHRTDAEAWLKKMHRWYGSKLKLFAGDLATMAEKSGYTLKGEEPEKKPAKTPVKKTRQQVSA